MLQRANFLPVPQGGSDTLNHIDSGVVAGESPAANRQPFTGNRQCNHHFRAPKALFRVAESSSRIKSLIVRMIVFLINGKRSIRDDVKQFTPENLYEQINGCASFFLAYDMIRMTYVSFVNSDETTQFINLSIYNMGTPNNAFGVFSAERSQGESPLELGRDLGVKTLVPMHWGTLVLSYEPPFEPPVRFLKAGLASGFSDERLWKMAVGQTRILG
jgi:hypothetical protein